MVYLGASNKKRSVNMRKFAIIIDSTVYLTKKQIEENELSVVSLNV